jgi:hypothetical protein
MVNLRFYIVSYNECRDSVIDNLSPDEQECVCCYSVNEKYEKNITNKIKNINEWDLPWHDSKYQDFQYYEYSLIPHILKNKELTTGLTHIGLLHFDTFFQKNSINDIRTNLLSNPRQIKNIHFITDKRSLYMSKEQLNQICIYMSSKLKLFINAENIWNIGWISHAMVIAPIDVYEKFGIFLINNHEDIEDMISNKRWGLIGHRTCGLVERMWGFYLVSLGMPIKKINNIIHDGSPYKHAAWEEDIINKITNK